VAEQRSDTELLHLIRKAQQYDSQALSALCEHFYADVYSYFYYRVSDPADAQDLTNDVFLRMVEAIRSFEPARGPFRTWIFSIAHHRLVDYRRRQAVRDHEPLTEALVNPHDQPAVQAEARLTRERLHRALDELTEDQRQVIVLKFVEGLSNAEVAKILEKTEGAINALQYRALQVLRQVLGADDE
jgi:RNA polymerase sigma-70 factor (ECF subfamily)